MRVRVVLVFLSLLFLAAEKESFPPRFNPDVDWLQFATSSVAGAPRDPISIRNVHRLTRAWRVALPNNEVCDGTPLYASTVFARKGPVDLVILETERGRVVALDAQSGSLIWSTNPPAGPRWTTSSPAIDSHKDYVFAYTLDGFVHRYAIETGREVTGGGWPLLITRKPDVEKGSSNLVIATAANAATYLYMTTAAYPDPGDEGNYQGHLVTMSIATGTSSVFNAACSDKQFVFYDSNDWRDCENKQSGIWARSGVTYDPVTDRVFVTVGNGVFDAHEGGFNWGSSVVALTPDGRADGGTPIDSYTPADYQFLTDEDLDLSSTGVVPLPVSATSKWPRLGVQSGKDGQIRLLNLENLSGNGGPRNIGGELQVIPVPQGGQVHTQPVAWFDAPRRRTWIFVANTRGISGLQLTEGPNGAPKLVERWSDLTLRSTTPVIVNGLLYSAGRNRISAIDARTGKVMWSDDSIGDIHWQSPIVANGMLYIADWSGFVTAYELAP